MFTVHAWNRYSTEQVVVRIAHSPSAIRRVSYFATVYAAENIERSRVDTLSFFSSLNIYRYDTVGRFIPCNMRVRPKSIDCLKTETSRMYFRGLI